MRRTGKRAFDPTMGSEGISQLLITYSIFMRRSLPKGAYFRTKRGSKKTGTRRCPFENKPVSGLLPALYVIGSLAVRVDVEAFALLFFGHTESHEEVRNLEGDECHHGGPDKYQPYRLCLNPKLGHDPGIAALHGDPVLHRAGPAEVRRVEHPGEQRAEYPADSMNAEHVERIVCTQ